jgi:hypothetical protein
VPTRYGIESLTLKGILEYLANIPVVDGAKLDEFFRRLREKFTGNETVSTESKTMRMIRV